MSESREQVQSEIGSGDQGGRWETPAVSYVDPARRFCAYCGRPIARRYWQVLRGGEAAAYCGPEHAARAAQNDISHKLG